jgi:hypothetical protein
VGICWIGLDRTSQPIVFILHEEEVNQFPRMKFFRGIFFKDAVSLQAINHVAKAPFLVQVTIDEIDH